MQPLLVLAIVGLWKPVQDGLQVMLYPAHLAFQLVYACVYVLVGGVLLHGRSFILRGCARGGRSERCHVAVDSSPLGSWSCFVLLQVELLLVGYR